MFFGVFHRRVFIGGAALEMAAKEIRALDRQGAVFITEIARLRELLTEKMKLLGENEKTIVKVIYEDRVQDPQGPWP